MLRRLYGISSTQLVVLKSTKATKLCGAAFHKEHRQFHQERRNWAGQVQEQKQFPSNDNFKSNIRFDRCFYEKTCRQLSLGEFKTPNDSTALYRLVYLPFDCATLRREQQFVDEYLAKWWDALTIHLADVRSSDLCKFTFNSLRKIAQVVGCQRLVKNLGVDALLAIADQIFASPAALSPKNFEFFLKNLRYFAKHSFDEKTRSKLAEKCADFAAAYFDLVLNCRVLFANAAHETIGNTLELLRLLGVENPSEDLREKLIRIYAAKLDDIVVPSPSKYEKQQTPQTLEDFRNLNLGATAFLHWNCDPNQYVPNIWSKWFQTTSNMVPELPQRSGFVTGVYLKLALQVALKFDQLDELNKIRHVWMQNIYANKKYIFENDRQILALECERKTQTEHRKLLDEISTALKA